MLNLNASKYSSVHLQFKKISPWIVNSSDMTVIGQNAAFLRHAVESKDKSVNIYQAQFNEVIDETEVLKYLGIASTGTIGSPFVGLDEYKNYKSAAITTLFAERFHYPGCFHTGAGRHVLLKNTHLKGIGRNILSINEDYTHSWGGLLVKDALKAYISSRYIDQRTQLPSLKIYGLFIYEKSDTDGVPHALLIRDSKTFRIAQAHPETLSVSEKNIMIDHLQKYFNHTNPAEILEKVLSNYIHAYSVGVRHKAISPDNLLIDGRWIDTESLDINLSKSAFDEWIQITVHADQDDFIPIQYSQFQSLVNAFEFKDSWIHGLYQMCKMTHSVYQGIFGHFDYNLDENFFKLISLYLPDIDSHLWKGILKTNSIPSFNLKDYYLRGYFFNPEQKIHTLTFGKTKEDSFDEMNKLTTRWEKIFWPMSTDWKESFSLADQIEKMCRSI